MSTLVPHCKVRVPFCVSSGLRFSVVPVSEYCARLKFCVLKIVNGLNPLPPRNPPLPELCGGGGCVWFVGGACEPPVFPVPEDGTWVPDVAPAASFDCVEFPAAFTAWTV